MSLRPSASMMLGSTARLSSVWDERGYRGEHDALALKTSPSLELRTAPYSVHVPGFMLGEVATPVVEFWLPREELI